MSMSTGMTGKSIVADRLPPIYGSNHPLGHMPAMRNHSLELFGKVRDEVGDIARLRFAHIYVYFLFDPEMVNHILVKNASNYEKRTRGYEKLRLLLGQGLVTSEGDFWKRQRRIAQPAFQRERIAGFVQSMTEAAADTASAWEPIARNSGQIDAAKAMMELTLRIAGETLFSTDISKDTDSFGKALTIALEHFHKVVSTPLPWPEYWPNIKNFRFWKAVRTLDKVVWSMIEQRRRSGEDQGDLLSMLMLARDEDTGEGMSDVQLRDEVFTMLSAGHETTANALTWTLYLLSQYPDVADKVAKENTDLLGDRLPTPQDLKLLTYTDQVLKESMRLYPPVWALGRKTKADDTLGDYHIPANTFVYFGPQSMQRHPKYWENPDAFDPDRFSPERWEEFKQNPYWRTTYFPFSRGQRMCIGDHFATMEGLAVLSVLARRFRFTLAPQANIVPEPSLTLRPKHGMPLILQSR